MSGKLKAGLVFMLTVVLLALVGYWIFLSSKTTSGNVSTAATATSNTANSAVTTTPTVSTSASVTAAELTTHNASASDCWIAINGSVYDVTSYSHPKLDPFTCGADNTSGWDSVSRHSTSLLSLVVYKGKLTN